MAEAAQTGKFLRIARPLDLEWQTGFITWLGLSPDKRDAALDLVETYSLTNSADPTAAADSLATATALNPMQSKQAFEGLCWFFEQLCHSNEVSDDVPRLITLLAGGTESPFLRIGESNPVEFVADIARRAIRIREYKSARAQASYGVNELTLISTGTALRHVIIPPSEKGAKEQKSFFPVVLIRLRMSAAYGDITFQADAQQLDQLIAIFEKTKKELDGLVSMANDQGATSE